MHQTRLPNTSNIKIERIVRSKRRTLALEISQDASLVVRAPIRASIDYIKKIIQQKELWILKKQRAARSKCEIFIPKEFVDGEGFLYLGNTYKLAIEQGRRPSLTLDKEFIISKRYLSEAKKIFITWYRNQAKINIHERLEWYSKFSGIKHIKFNITGAKKRWGSCSGKGNLNFSWRLIMAPLKVIDYVVVHELAHVIVKNHSKAFWTKVASIMPDYKSHKDWLRHNGFLLNL